MGKADSARKRYRKRKRAMRANEGEDCRRSESDSELCDVLDPATALSEELQLRDAVPAVGRQETLAELLGRPSPARPPIQKGPPAFDVERTELVGPMPPRVAWQLIHALPAVEDGDLYRARVRAAHTLLQWLEPPDSFDRAAFKVAIYVRSKVPPPAPIHVRPPRLILLHIYDRDLVCYVETIGPRGHAPGLTQTCLPLCRWSCAHMPVQLRHGAIHNPFGVPMCGEFRGWGIHMSQLKGALLQGRPCSVLLSQPNFFPQPSGRGGPATFPTSPPPPLGAKMQNEVYVPDQCRCGDPECDMAAGWHAGHAQARGLSREFTRVLEATHASEYARQAALRESYLEPYAEHKELVEAHTLGDQHGLFISSDNKTSLLHDRENFGQFNFLRFICGERVAKRWKKGDDLGVWAMLGGEIYTDIVPDLEIIFNAAMEHAAINSRELLPLGCDPALGEAAAEHANKCREAALQDVRADPALMAGFKDENDAAKFHAGPIGLTTFQSPTVTAQFLRAANAGCPGSVIYRRRGLDPEHTEDKEHMEEPEREPETPEGRKARVQGARRAKAAADALFLEQMLALSVGDKIKVCWDERQAVVGEVMELPLRALRAEDVSVRLQYESLGCCMREFLHGYRWQVVRK